MNRSGHTEVRLALRALLLALTEAARWVDVGWALQVARPWWRAQERRQRLPPASPAVAAGPGEALAAVRRCIQALERRIEACDDADLQEVFEGYPRGYGSFEEFADEMRFYWEAAEDAPGEGTAAHMAATGRRARLLAARRRGR